MCIVAAGRASLLVRMGEGEAARELVQDVDAGNYTPALTQAAMDAFDDQSLSIATVGSMASLRGYLTHEGHALVSAALDAIITQQAQIISYIDDYKLLMIAMLSVFPLLIVFKKTAYSDADHTLAVE